MKKLLSVAVLSLTLSACATMGNKAIREQSNFDKLVVGTTTRAGVHARFGQPHDVFDETGRRGWRYIVASSSPEPFTFVLGVIIWPLIALQQTDYEVTQSDFFFDGNGALLYSTSRQSQLRKSLLSIGDAFSDSQKAAVLRVRTEMETNALPYDEKAAKGSLAYLVAGAAPTIGPAPTVARSVPTPVAAVLPLSSPVTAPAPTAPQ